MHITIRRWNNASHLIAEMHERGNEVEELITTTPGFIAYHAVESGDTLISVTVCRDKAGTDETTRRAAEWVREKLPAEALAGLAPEVTEGDAFINFDAPQRTSTARTVDTADAKTSGEATV